MVNVGSSWGDDIKIDERSYMTGGAARCVRVSHDPVIEFGPGVAQPSLVLQTSERIEAAATSRRRRIQPET